MQVSEKIDCMKTVRRGLQAPCSPIPVEGEWVHPASIEDISGVSQGVNTCPPQQGACKLSLNVKKGIIKECLIETIGCAGMAQAAAMAAEILPGRNLIEALNTALVCDAINSAMRDVMLHLLYGRAQTGFSSGGLPVGHLFDEIGSNNFSQVSTIYGSEQKGPRYLFMNEGYVTRMALDANHECIGYETLNMGKLMRLHREGMSLDAAFPLCLETGGRFSEGVEFIDPRAE